jgi:hypothetical protein
LYPVVFKFAMFCASVSSCVCMLFIPLADVHNERIVIVYTSLSIRS